MLEARARNISCRWFVVSPWSKDAASYENLESYLACEFAKMGTV